MNKENRVKSNSTENTSVLIIGGYGNFGSLIAQLLAKEPHIKLIIAGRNINKAHALINHLNAKQQPEAAFIDIHNDIDTVLNRLQPHIVIHTSGPFQSQNYSVAEACIRQQCHYIDLADARDYVTHINKLDKQAKESGVLVCSGASSVPCLTAAIIDHYLDEFDALEKIDYAIATAQLTNRGLVTTSAVLSYAGKPFSTLINGKETEVYGWLGLKWRRFWQLNLRALGDCDIPDLSLFPERYPTLKTLRFRASLELKLLHLVLVFLARLVKMGLINSLQPLASLLLKISYAFDLFGKDHSGFYMTLSGIKDEADKNITFEMAARNGDGLYIPSTPAVILAKKLANKEVSQTGATACLDLISLDEYLAALEAFDIQWRTHEKSL